MTTSYDTPAPHGNDADNRQRLWKMIRGIRFAMLTTRHGNGHLHARPVTTQNSGLDEDSSLWFFMSRRGEPVADLVVDPVVNVAYADPGEDSYVSISGTATLVDDLAKKQQLWTKAAEVWFPAGVGDPDLALVRVRITHANYWDVKESKLVQLLHLAKAAVTGKPPTELGEHGVIRMS
jgi:general stress protein 26